LDEFRAISLSINTFSYDVYTPTRNIVFHDYGFQKNLHGNNEWFKRQRDRFRQASLMRVKTLLQLPGGETDINDQANLGIYGLGKRRTLEQLSAFTGMRLSNGRGTEGTTCTGHEWVPYDASILPTVNLFINPDNLDPQPEYPLRTNLTFYVPPVASQSQAVGISRQAMRSEILRGMDEQMHSIDVATDSGNFPSVIVLFLLWTFGLLVWFVMYTPNSITGGDKKKHSRPTVVRRKSSDLYKEI
jgi:Glycosyltransferase (GlcNAc)